MAGVQTEEEVCSVCGSSQEKWTANQGSGFEKGRKLYCCEGCAKHKRCICEGR